MKVIKYILYFNLLLLIACGPKAAEDRFKEETPAEAEDKPVEITLKRLEQDLFACTPDNVNSQIDTLRRKYGKFFDLYVLAIARFSRPDDPLLDIKVLDFINDGDIKIIRQDINKQYADVTDLKEQLSKGFTRFKHFFPEKNVPTIVTYLGAFNQSITTTETELGIGLDLYLGRNYGYYTNLQLPAYKTLSYSKEYIATDALFNWSVTEFIDSSNNMLGYMLHQGKMLFLLDALYPNVDDTIKLRYTAAQNQWCIDNEANIWAHMVDKNLLYSTSGKEINKYCQEHPFTPGMAKESPGRIGNWLGWQIVKAYMRKHTDLTMADLFKITDAQKMLAESGYRPQKPS